MASSQRSSNLDFSMRHVFLGNLASKRLVVTLPHKADYIHGSQFTEIVVPLASSTKLLLPTHQTRI